MRRLLVGPYPGEFGWELCLFNPIARARALDFEHVTVMAPASSRYLYEFADAFVSIEVEPGTSDFMDGALVDASVPDRSLFAEVLAPERAMVGRELASFGKPYPGPESTPWKRWRSLAPEPAPEGVHSRPQVVCAFRPPKVLGARVHTDKAYPEEHCAELVLGLLKRGVSVACLGGRDNYSPRGAMDMRGAPLEAQCAYLASARVAVGPSSGPMHLAQLCGTPVVTWYARPRAESIGRYEGWWNPFRAGCTFLEALRPSPEEVVRAALEYL